MRQYIYIILFEICCSVKKCKRRELTEDSDNALYFLWSDQTLLQELLYYQSGKQSLHEF
jgi:hypothetical protein